MKQCYALYALQCICIRTRGLTNNCHSLFGTWTFKRPIQRLNPLAHLCTQVVQTHICLIPIMFVMQRIILVSFVKCNKKKCFYKRSVTGTSVTQHNTVYKCVRIMRIFYLHISNTLDMRGCSYLVCIRCNSLVWKVWVALASEREK